MGWVLTAFQNAFYELQTGEPLEECLIHTVAAGGAGADLPPASGGFQS